MDADIYITPGELQLLRLDSRVAFLDNLSQHFRSDEFSDVTLVVGGKYFPAHKTILATASSYFQRMFYGGAWREGTGEEVELQEEPDCEEEFEMFLRYFYSGTVSVTRETVIPILTLADKYDVQGLRDICSSYMISVLNKIRDPKIALSWVTFAGQMRLDDLEKSCYNIICCNFEKAYSLADWRSLPLEQVLVILKRKDLIVSDEYIVYEAVQEWLLGKDITQQHVSSILPHIQLKNMTVEQIRQVELNPLETNNRCKTDYLLHPYLYDAYRYVAVKDHFPGGDIEHAKIQRCYTDATAMTSVIFERIFEDGCALVKPKCTWSTEPLRYRWELFKPQGSTKYQISLPQVSRIHYDPHIGRRTIHLRSSLSGAIRLNVTFVFRNKDGLNLFGLKDSFKVSIPARGGTLVEFPELEGDSCECFPHDVMFLFDIEKV